jgi:hypothetical protein
MSQMSLKFKTVGLDRLEKKLISLLNAKILQVQIPMLYDVIHFKTDIYLKILDRPSQI